jgi:protein TonB
MTRYERSSFFVAAVISITVHATAAVYLAHYDVPFADQPQSAASVMRISLAPTRTAAPQPEPEPKPISPPKPEPEPPSPPRKPAPKSEPVRKPAPKSEPVREPEPVIEPAPVSNEVPETTEVAEEQTAASAYTEAPVDKPALDQMALEIERKSYLLRLLVHIDSYKFYPRKARQRGMEGKINIAFYLHEDGSISDLQVSGGSRLLRTAARQAVQQALSLPRPPESFHLANTFWHGLPP